jgi:hypothetical protein
VARGGKRPGAGRKPVLNAYQQLWVCAAFTRLEQVELERVNATRRARIEEWRDNRSNYDDFVADLHEIPINRRLNTKGDNLSEAVQERLNAIREEKAILIRGYGCPRIYIRKKSGKREEFRRAVARDASKLWGLNPASYHQGYSVPS